jgi:MFS family permease
VVGDVYPPERRARSLGVLGAIDTLGWVWGPMYGAVLVRFLSWHWQFWLNIPLAIFGMLAAWWALAPLDQQSRTSRIDWVGAGTLTVALVSLSVALLSSAEIQSVTGLEELTGSGGIGGPWLFVVSAVALAFFIYHQRRTDDPLIDVSLFKGRNLTVAMIINFLVGAGLIIAMVDVPLFVNVVEIDLERSAIIAGAVLSALTAAMTITSYAGGLIAERTWYQPPTLIGLALALAAFLLMGFGWNPDTTYTSMAWQLAILGAGFGLVIAPTSAAVVDAAPPDRRGTAAGLVIVLRLIGLSVGLAGLTSWGLYRFNELRGTIELPPITDPGYAAAVTRAQAELTTASLSETFLAAAVVIAVALAIGFTMRRDRAAVTETTL